MNGSRSTAVAHAAVMGGNAHIVVVDGPHDAPATATRRLAQLEARWSRFDPTSEVSLLNANAGTIVGVSGDTLRLVEAACAGWRTTRGAFDPTILDALTAAGYDRTFADVRRCDDPLPAPGPSVRSFGCRGVVVDRAASTVALPAWTRIDPGGIGKGLAADIVAAELVASGAAGACVNVGGDVRVCGDSASGRGWPIGIDDPHDAGEMLACVVLDDGAVASSSRLLRSWGPGRHHLLDPSTGRPVANGVAAVSVVATDAALAEVLTKATFVLGDGAAPLLVDAAAGALMVGDDRRITLLGSWPPESLDGRVATSRRPQH